MERIVFFGVCTSSGIVQGGNSAIAYPVDFIGGFCVFPIQIDQTTVTAIVVKANKGAADRLILASLS